MEYERSSDGFAFIDSPFFDEVHRRAYYMTRFTELMTFTLSRIEPILASGNLRVESEDDVYEFVLKWARQHYNKPEERREVLDTRLAHLIRSPYMIYHKLKEVLIYDDFTHKIVSKFVFEALFFKAQQSPTTSASLNFRFVERAYKYRPIKVVEFKLPRQHCVMYWDLMRDDCAALFPFGREKSQAFHLGGHKFFLLGACSMNNQRNFHYFELAVELRRKPRVSFVVDCEFAARSRPSVEFVTKYKSHCTFTKTKGELVGIGNLFRITWDEFMAKDRPFLINGVLHLKVKITIRRCSLYFYL